MYVVYILFIYTLFNSHIIFGKTKLKTERYILSNLFLDPFLVYLCRIPYHKHSTRLRDTVFPFPAQSCDCCWSVSVIVYEQPHGYSVLLCIDFAFQRPITRTLS